MYSFRVPSGIIHVDEFLEVGISEHSDTHKSMYSKLGVM